VGQLDDGKTLIVKTQHTSPQAAGVPYTALFTLEMNSTHLATHPTVSFMLTDLLTLSGSDEVGDCWVYHESGLGGEFFFHTKKTQEGKYLLRYVNAEVRIFSTKETLKPEAFASSCLHPSSWLCVRDLADTQG